MGQASEAPVKFPLVLVVCLCASLVHRCPWGVLTEKPALPKVSVPALWVFQSSGYVLGNWQQLFSFCASLSWMGAYSPPPAATLRFWVDMRAGAPDQWSVHLLVTSAVFGMSYTLYPHKNPEGKYTVAPTINPITSRKKTLGSLCSGREKSLARGRGPQPGCMPKQIPVLQ